MFDFGFGEMADTIRATGQKIAKMGMRASPTAVFVFNDCEVVFIPETVRARLPLHSSPVVPFPVLGRI